MHSTICLGDAPVDKYGRKVRIVSCENNAGSHVTCIVTRVLCPQVATMSTAARKDHIKKFYGIDEGEADESSEEDDEEDKDEDASEQEDSSDDADANAGPKLGVLHKTACQ